MVQSAFHQQQQQRQGDGYLHQPLHCAQLQHAPLQWTSSQSGQQHNREVGPEAFQGLGNAGGSLNAGDLLQHCGGVGSVSVEQNQGENHQLLAWCNLTIDTVPKAPQQQPPASTMSMNENTKDNSLHQQQQQIFHAMNSGNALKSASGEDASNIFNSQQQLLWSSLMQQQQQQQQQDLLKQQQQQDLLKQQQQQNMSKQQQQQYRLQHQQQQNMLKQQQQQIMLKQQQQNMLKQQQQQQNMLKQQQQQQQELMRQQQQQQQHVMQQAAKSVSGMIDQKLQQLKQQQEEIQQQQNQLMQLQVMAAAQAAGDGLLQHAQKQQQALLQQQHGQGSQTTTATGLFTLNATVSSSPTPASSGGVASPSIEGQLLSDAVSSQQEVAPVSVPSSASLHVSERHKQQQSPMGQKNCLKPPEAVPSSGGTTTTNDLQELFASTKACYFPASKPFQLPGLVASKTTTAQRNQHQLLQQLHLQQGNNAGQGSVGFSVTGGFLLSTSTAPHNMTTGNMMSQQQQDLLKQACSTSPSPSKQAESATNNSSDSTPLLGHWSGSANSLDDVEDDLLGFSAAIDPKEPTVNAPASPKPSRSPLASGGGVNATFGPLRPNHCNLQHPQQQQQQTSNLATTSLGPHAGNAPGSNQAISGNKRTWCPHPQASTSDPSTANKARRTGTLSPRQQTNQSVVTAPFPQQTLSLSSLSPYGATKLQQEQPKQQMAPFVRVHDGGGIFPSIQQNPSAHSERSSLDQSSVEMTRANAPTLQRRFPDNHASGSFPDGISSAGGTSSQSGLDSIPQDVDVDGADKTDTQNSLLSGPLEKNLSAPQASIVSSAPTALVSSSTPAPTTPKSGPPTNPQNFLKDMVSSRGYCTSLEPSTEKKNGRGENVYHLNPTPLQLASYGTKVVKAMNNSDVVTMADLLSCGISRNPSNNFSDSVLHMVCKRSDLKMFQCLMQNGCPVHFADSFGRTPLHMAAWAATTCFEAVEVLLDADAGMLFVTDKRGMAPLQYVSKDKWQAWNDFLEARRDKYWPVRIKKVLGGAAAQSQIRCRGDEMPLARKPCNPDPTEREGVVSVEVAAQLVSGQLEPSVVRERKLGLGEQEASAGCA